MDRKGELGCEEKKENLKEYDDLIYTLAALSEIVAWNGIDILERIYSGTFDEADLKREEIPIKYRYKVKLELLRNNFFGALIFAFQLIDDYAYACRALEKYIRNRKCSLNTYCKMTLVYQGICMIYKKSLPWEIEYQLQSLTGRKRTLEQCMESYKREEETYIECVQRYYSHWKTSKK